MRGSGLFGGGLRRSLEGQDRCAFFGFFLVFAVELVLADKTVEVQRFGQIFFGFVMTREAHERKGAIDRRAFFAESLELFEAFGFFFGLRENVCECVDAEESDRIVWWEGSQKLFVGLLRFGEFFLFGVDVSEIKVRKCPCARACVVLGDFFKIGGGGFLAFSFGLEGFLGVLGAGVVADLGLVGLEGFAERLGRGFVVAFLHIEEQEHSERYQEDGDETREDLMAVVVNPVETLGADLDKLIRLFEFFAARFAATFGLVCCLDHEGLPCLFPMPACRYKNANARSASHMNEEAMSLCWLKGLSLYASQAPASMPKSSFALFPVCLRRTNQFKGGVQGDTPQKKPTVRVGC